MTPQPATNKAARHPPTLMIRGCFMIRLQLNLGYYESIHSAGTLRLPASTSGNALLGCPVWNARIASAGKTASHAPTRSQVKSLISMIRPN